MPGTPVDSARSAVEQAIAAAPYDPAFGPPVQALNAQPISSEPLHPDGIVAQSPAPPPPMQHSDTPMLVLPSDGSNSMTATQPLATQPNESISGVAPPPVPPPLMAGPGVVPFNQPPVL
jgi:hypothetical protein